MNLPRPRRFLWGLLLALAALKACSPRWLPSASPLHRSLCPLMPGLPACR